MGNSKMLTTLLKPSSYSRFTSVCSQCNYSSKNIKLQQQQQLQQEEEEPKKKQLAIKKLSERKTKKYDPHEVKKEDLIWRTPWHQKAGAQISLFRAFYSDQNRSSLMKFVQQPIDLSPRAIKDWWTRTKEFQEAFMQQYIPERHEILGPELATAHFIVHRGGAVKFHQDDKWIKAVKGQYELPRHYVENLTLEAIDCTDMNLYFEGLDNLRGLKEVQWLSFNGCKNIDDFCIDCISNIFSHSVVYLDLRNCFNISERGIGALYKMRKLKVLYLDDMLKDTKYEMTCLLLQELNPLLEIKSDVVTFEIK